MPTTYGDALREMQKHYRVVAPDPDHKALLLSNEWATQGFRCNTGYFKPNVAAWLRVVYVVHDPETGYVKIGMTTQHDRAVLARIHEQAKGEPWDVVGLAIALRQPRPWYRSYATVSNLDDELRRALLDRGVVDSVDAQGVGRDWVVVVGRGEDFLRAIELECWRRGHAWLEPGFDGGDGGGAQDDSQFAPGFPVTQDTFDYGDLYRTGRFPQTVMWRTAPGPVTLGGDFFNPADADATEALGASYEAIGAAGESNPVRAFVVMQGTAASQPFVFPDTDDGGGSSGAGGDNIESQAFDLMGSVARTSSVGSELSSVVGSPLTPDESGAQPSPKRPRVAGSVTFAKFEVEQLGSLKESISENDVVYVKERGKIMYDFAPVWNENMIRVVEQLQHGVKFNRRSKQITGFVGIVRKLKVRDNGMLQFDLYWKDENIGWKFYPYKVPKTKVYRIGKITEAAARSIDQNSVHAVQSQPQERLTGCAAGLLRF